MYWTDILTALALVLVIEGMLPFISPEKYRDWVLQVIKLPDAQLRNAGLIAMIAGLLLLFLVRS